jgi:opacity protein-like surface antigen
MRNRLMVCLMALTFSTLAFAQAQQAADSYAGAWAGTWTAADGGSGDVEITFEKGKDGAPAGKVKTSGGGVEHSANFKSLSIDGKKLTGKYEYPLEGGGEITMDGTLDTSTAKGTWELHQASGTAAVAQGTWTVTKK